MFMTSLLLQKNAALVAVPTDPASLFVYALLIVSGFAIWKGSRAKKQD